MGKNSDAATLMLIQTVGRQLDEDYRLLKRNFIKNSYSDNCASWSSITIEMITLQPL